MVDHKVPITSGKLVTDMLNTNENIDVTEVKIKQFMKNELGMKYRISKKIPTQANS